MIITYVNLLTKQAHFLLCNSTITAEGVADMHVKCIFPLHGTLEKFILDRRPQFAACMMLELYQQLGIEHAMSSAFHPQSNGQTERTNQEIVKYLRMFCSKDQQGWAKLLPIAEFAYNLHVHLVTKSSPFKMLYGYQPTWNTPPGASAQMPSVSACLLELHKARDKAKAALRMSKEAMIWDSKADCSRPVFSPGNMVWLDSENIKIQTKSKKLVDKQVGPFKVVAMEEGQSRPMYRLDLPPSYKSLHPVFSVDRLSLWHSNNINGIWPPPPAPVIIKDQEQYEIETILDSWKWGQGLQYLVHWKGYNKSHNQWLSRSLLLQDAPEAVTNFHKSKPNAPQVVSALFWKSIQWHLYKNLTETVHPGVDWVKGKFTGILACQDNKP
jgi:hypothetical protein